MPHAKHLPGCTARSFEECWCEAWRYTFIALITLVILAVQLIGGWQAGSVSLLADSIHVALDGVGALLSLYVVLTIRNVHEGEEFEERYMRLSARLLLIGLVLITVESIYRVMVPSPVEGGLMLVAAALGGALNGVQFLVLRDGIKRAMSRAQLLHIAVDFGSSVAVCIGALLLWKFHVARADAVTSLVVVAIGAWHTVPMAFGKHHSHN